MLSTGDELLRAIAIIADDENVRVTFQQSGIGALVCAASALAGGLLLGPRGLAVGGAAGGVAAYLMTEGSFRSLGDVLTNDLTPTQRKELNRHLDNVIQNFNAGDIVDSVSSIMKHTRLKEALLATVINYATKNLQLAVITQ